MLTTAKVAIAQLNPTVGALRENADRAMQVMQEMEATGADLLVFPEMYIPGYPAQDHILSKRT